MSETKPPAPPAPAPPSRAPPSRATTPRPQPATPMPAWPKEIGGAAGPEPTRYGDWEHKGRCTDF